MLTSLELCAGAGGQALGLERAGFRHVALVEVEPQYCETLHANRPEWNIVNADLRDFDATPYKGVDLVCGGVPCPPYSVAGKQLGPDDERDLFPTALRVVEEADPRAVMIENVRGILQPRFDEIRVGILARLESMGYRCWWRLVQASDYGVSQLRPRAILVAVRPPYADFFEWPTVSSEPAPTVGELLHDEMAAGGWEGADEWALRADGIAPTLVGGSKKHGGPDLGPTRARKAWAELGVNGGSIAEEPPGPGFSGMPRLTVRMAAMVQGFPPEWRFVGGKTVAYRQVGNAFPPPVAEAVGVSIRKALMTGGQRRSAGDEGARGVDAAQAWAWQISCGVGR